MTQYTEAESRAAVEAAENWGTYVMVHVHTPRAIQMAIRAGVKSIGHGNMVDEATAKLMVEKGVWLSVQPFLEDETAFSRHHWYVLYPLHSLICTSMLRDIARACAENTSA